MTCSECILTLLCWALYYFFAYLPLGRASASDLRRRTASINFSHATVLCSASALPQHPTRVPGGLLVSPGFGRLGRRAGPFFVGSPAGNLQDGGSPGPGPQGEPFSSTPGTSDLTFFWGWPALGLPRGSKSLFASPLLPLAFVVVCLLLPSSPPRQTAQPARDQRGGAQVCKAGRQHAPLLDVGQGPPSGRRIWRICAISSGSI